MMRQLLLMMRQLPWVFAGDKFFTGEADVLFVVSCHTIIAQPRGIGALITVVKDSQDYDEVR